MSKIRSSKFIAVLVAIVFLAIGLFAGRAIFKPADLPPALPPTFFQQADGGTGNWTQKGVFSGTIHEVKNGQVIQDAVRKAVPGDLIRVWPGTYNETVYIDKDNITIQGVIVKGEWPVLDGKKVLNDGFLYSGNGMVIENFVIKDYKGNGIMGQAGNNFIIRNNRVHDAGVYGIFPEYGTNGLVERNVLSGIEDAAIYMGMCDNIDVRYNYVYESVAGIEIENCRHALVEYNYCFNNTGGILAFITPGLPIKTCYDVIIRNNYVFENNHPNFGAEGSIVASLPSGTGIIVMAADEVVIENNIIAGNKNLGIAITDFSFGANMRSDPDSDPNPDRLVILDNLMYDNGLDPSTEEIRTLMSTGVIKRAPDIAVVGNGSGSCILNKGAYQTYGLDNWGQCQIASTASVKTYMLSEPVPPRDVTLEEKGKMTYYGVCSGCHSYSVRMVGPPTQVIQALYKGNPQGIADYIANPARKREDYPEMPPQNYLSEETRLAVAEYMLTVDK
ncbi:MAG: right-handed parallel beta-helix repeat-containing protein [Flavobacteriales bacterium]|nr:right-handed parallel beta-helix repeat-containing protein [Flavobacteriales bacterium]